MTRRLVFVTSRPPFTRTSGSSLRTHRLITGLCDVFEVTVVALAHGPRAGEQHGDIAELQALLPGAQVVTVEGRTWPKRVGQLRSLPRRRSWEWGRYAVRSLVPAVARHSPGAIVHIDDLGVAEALSVPADLAAFAPHNVEHAIVRAAAKAAQGPRRLFSELDWRRVAVEEHRAWRQADLCVAVSELDALAMTAGGARRVTVSPNGTDPVDPLPLRQWNRGAEPLRLLFVGTGHYQPNERGIAWFVSEVMPRLRALEDVELDVVGSPPRRPVQHAGVVYAGRVPEVTPWYERAHMAVVPIFEGSGTRLKVVEAMALGRPLVSTKLGAEGLPVAPDAEYVAADDVATFVEAIMGVAADLASGGSSATEARVARARIAAAGLFWPAIARRLSESYSEIAGAGARR